MKKIKFLREGYRPNLYFLNKTNIQATTTKCKSKMAFFYFFCGQHIILNWNRLAKSGLNTYAYRNRLQPINLKDVIFGVF